MGWRESPQMFICSLNVCLRHALVCFLLPWYTQGPKATSSSSSQSISKGKQGRNLGTGTDAETLEEPSLLACCLWLLSSPGPPRHDPAAVSCTLPHQPLMRNMPHGLSYRPFRYRQFLHWGSLLADNPGLCRVNHTQSVCGSYRELSSQIRQLTAVTPNPGALMHSSEIQALHSYIHGHGRTYIRA